MSFKVFTIVFLGLLAVSQTIQSPVLEDKGNKDNIVQIVAVILQVSDELLEMANDIIDKFDNNQAEYKEKIIALFNAYGKQINAIFLKLVDQLKEGSTTDGVAVVDCFEAQQEITEAAFSKIYSKGGDCVAAEATDIIKQVRIIVQQLTDLKVDIEDKVNKLDQCKESDEKCLDEFLTELGGIAKRILAVVKEDLEKVLKEALNIVKNIEKCAEPVVPEVKTMVHDIFNEFVICVKK